MNELALLAVIACPACFRAGGADGHAYMIATVVMLAVPAVLGTGFFVLFRSAPR